MAESNDNPLVSIICLTYNHAPYIRECLDGFLMQKTDFPFEVIIHDDASTDGTTDIVKEYAVKYPNKIKPIIQTENQYSKHHGFSYVIKSCVDHCLGKYIAFCEGDDYWIASYKLQKQVDFFDSNPDVDYVCHRYYERYFNEATLTLAPNKRLDKNNEDGFYFNIHDFLHSAWFTKTLTCMIRAESIKNIDFDFELFRDVHMVAQVLLKGKGYCFSFIGGVYRRQSIGIWSLLNGRDQLLISMNVWKEISRKINYPEFRVCYYKRLFGYVIYNIKTRQSLSELKKDKQTLKDIFYSIPVVLKSFFRMNRYLGK